MNKEDNIDKLNDLFDENTDNIGEVDTEKEHQIGENDWVERRKNPHGRRKEDKDRLIATKILLVMTIIMIIVTAGILGIELQVKKELEDSIKNSSYEYSVKKFETNQKHQEMRDADKREAEEAKNEENNEETQNQDENKEENIIEKVVENVWEVTETDME